MPTPIHTQGALTKGGSRPTGQTLLSCTGSTNAHLGDTAGQPTVLCSTDRGVWCTAGKGLGKHGLEDGLLLRPALLSQHMPQ